MCELYNPSRRSSAWSAPLSPLAKAASAAFTKRTFSAAVKRRRDLRGLLSFVAPLSDVSSFEAAFTEDLRCDDLEMGLVRQSNWSELR